MRSTLLASAAALMFTAATPAMAQGYGTSAPQTPPAEASAPTNTRAAANAKPPLCSMKISGGARKALVEFQKAADAKNVAAIPGAIEASKAAVKTPEDRCVLGQLMLKSAADGNDFVGMGAGVDQMVQSGVANATALGPIVSTLGKMRYNAKDYTGAATAFQQSLTITPNDPEAYMLLGESRAKLGQTDDAFTQFGKAFAIRKAAGQPIEEIWLKRAVALSYEAKNPKVYGFSRQWVAAYPTVKNWRDTLKIYQAVSALPTSELVDIYRLQRANKALMGEADYVNYAIALLQKGYPGEAKVMLEEGIAAKLISTTSPSVGPALAQATTRAAGDRASLAALAKAATAAADGKKAVNAGDAYYGYGDYAQAAALYRAALTKSGTDKDIANLRLGMSLTMAGDKAGAQAALSAVTGPKAEVAQFWMTYLAQRG